MKYYKAIMIALRFAASMMILYMIASCSRPDIQVSNPLPNIDLYSIPGISHRIIGINRTTGMIFEIRFSPMPPYKVDEILLLEPIIIKDK